MGLLLCGGIAVAALRVEKARELIGKLGRFTEHSLHVNVVHLLSLATARCFGGSDSLRRKGTVSFEQAVVVGPL